jgi:hypothetical protein
MAYRPLLIGQPFSLVARHQQRRMGILNLVIVSRAIGRGADNLNTGSFSPPGDLFIRPAICWLKGRPSFLAQPPRQMGLRLLLTSMEPVARA